MVSLGNYYIQGKHRQNPGGMRWKKRNKMSRGAREKVRQSKRERERETLEGTD